jgi:hypothetical protein
MNAFTSFFCVLATAATAAPAQPYGQTVVIGGGYQAKAATSFESICRGNAELLRACTEYHAAAAQARYYASDVRFEFRLRKAERERQARAEELARARARAQRNPLLPVAHGQPRRAASPVSADGAIAWADTLLADEHRETRRQLEGLFKERARGLRPGREVLHRKAIIDACDELQREFDPRRGDFLVEDAVATRKFIEALKNEGRRPLREERLAGF